MAAGWPRVHKHTVESMQAAASQHNVDTLYGYGPLVKECGKRGIGRTVAFQLAAKGLIETFTIGSKRFVRLRSLESLPDRLLKDQGSPLNASIAGGEPGN